MPSWDIVIPSYQCPHLFWSRDKTSCYHQDRFPGECEEGDDCPIKVKSEVKR